MYFLFKQSTFWNVSIGVVLCTKWTHWIKLWIIGNNARYLKTSGASCKKVFLSQQNSQQFCMIDALFSSNLLSLTWIVLFWSLLSDCRLDNVCLFYFKKWKKNNFLYILLKWVFVRNFSNETNDEFQIIW